MSSSGKEAAGSKKTETKSPNDAFESYYGMLLHQQNMLQDRTRTGTYEKAILGNSSDFAGKVVLDVGTGSGILAYFAVKAGAKKVYAVEASAMAIHAKKLIAANGLSDKIIVLHGKIEDIEPPEKVDVVISEPMGFLLVHERMLEVFVSARTLWMKPGGLMLPSKGCIYVNVFTDAALYNEQMGKVDFWENRDFYGLDLSCLREEAIENHYSQPVVGYFTPDILLCSDAIEHPVDFSSMSMGELKEFDIPVKFVINKTALMHGLACWFDVDFNGSTTKLRLGTGPTDPHTHWYQCRLMLKAPLAVNASQVISGNMHFKINEKSSYHIDIELSLDGTTIKASNRINLHDQMYHYLTQPYPDTTAQQWDQQESETAQTQGYGY